MSTIPLSKDFNITPNVVSPAGDALDANGLVLTDSTLIPSGSVRAFYEASEVSALFGSDSREYQAAVVYFNGYDNSSVTPGTLLMTRTQGTAAAGYLMSGSQKGVPLSQLKAIPSGTLTLSVDGKTQTSQAIDLSSATSQSGIASTIQAALTGVNVAWNPTANVFIITSATTGADSAVTFAADNALSRGLKLTAATGGQLSAGNATTSLTDTLNNVVDSNQNWIGLASVVDLDDAERLEIAAWVNSQNSRYFYSMHDGDADALISDSSTAFVPNQLLPAGYENVFPIYGDYLDAMTALAYAASINFYQTAGRVSYKFRKFTGIVPKVTSLSQARALESNGYNYYGDYGLNKTLKQYAADGSITGKYLWLDSFVDQVWMNANLVSAYAELFTNNQSYSYNAQGYAAIQAATIDVANNAVNFGAIQRGVTLDNSQVKQISTVVGKDISATLYSDGWYLHIPTQTGASRIERSLNGVVFYYVDGQLIQSINMASTAIL